MATKKNEGNTVITIKAPKIQKTRITIVGDTPLLVHAWSEKARRMMLEAQQKVKKDKKAMAIRCPFHEFVNALYWVTPKPDFDSMTEDEMIEAFEKAIEDGAKFGFPVTAIKQGALSSCFRAGITTNKTFLNSAFYLNAVDGINCGTGSELAVIRTNSAPVCREDMVKIGPTHTADLRYRPAFTDWEIDLEVTLIDTGVFSMESVINAINLAGQMNGLGEWRMEKNGEFGRFHVKCEEA